MRKRLVALVLTLSLLGGLLPLSSCSNILKNEDNDEYVGRGQWITMLAEAFGMNSYTSDTPYYSDVPSGDSLFDYVQASSEWGVLSVYTDEKLDVAKRVSREEVASTAAIAAGYEISEGEIRSDGSFDTGNSIAFAVDQGLIDPRDDLSDYMTQDACETVINAARVAYLTAPLKRESDTAILSEDVADLKNLSLDEFDISGSTVLIPYNYSGSAGNTGNETGNVDAEGIAGEESAGEGTGPFNNEVIQNDDGTLKALVETINGPVEVGVGDVFITPPTAENPAGVAYKVTNIEDTGAEIVFTTTEPTLEDLFDELDVHMTVSADASNIIWAPGVNIESVSGLATGGTSYRVCLMSSSFSPSDLAPLASFTEGFSKDFSFGSGSFEKNWSNKNSSAVGGGKGAQVLENSSFVYDSTPSIEDFGGSQEPWTKDLKVENKFSGGYKITGNISINAITVTTDVEYKKIKFTEIPYGIENASIKVDSDISATLTMQGNLSEELRIATVPIPIAATGLSVSIDLFLYADASGSLQVRASLANTAKIEYRDKRLKQSAQSTANADVDVAVEINFGANLTGTLDALGIVKIMDVGAKVGGNLTASAHVNGNCEASEVDGTTTFTYTESMDIKADLYVPILNVSAGGSGTLIGKLGIGGSWDILTKSNGAKKFTLIDENWEFWREVVTINKEGEEIDSSGNVSGDRDPVTNPDEDYKEVGPTDEARLDLTSYVVTLRGEPVQLQLELEDGQAAPAVVWTSENPAVAEVDSNGLVRPVSTGTTVITVSLQDDPNVSVKCVVYVEEIGEANWEFLPADMDV